MTPQEGHSVLPQGPVLKNAEITELSDVHFFHPLGKILAGLALHLRMTPIQVTIFGAMIGVVGGAMLYDEHLGLLAFALLIIHGIIDSADGQLARMTGQVSELGRVLDGAGGYVTYVAIYLAIAAGVIQRGGNVSILGWMVLAGLVNALQAQMYEYYRPAYVSVVREGRVSRSDPAAVPSGLRWLYRGYLQTQHCLIGLHTNVQARLAARSVAGRIRDEDRARYRDCFYRTARGWNLFGDNTRFYAIGLLACLHRTDLFFLFILGPMNLALIVQWLRQRSADRRFLASL